MCIRDRNADDNLIGISKIPLRIAFESLILDEESLMLNARMVRNNLYPIMVHDELASVRDLHSDTEAGVLQIIAAVGTAAQLSRLETRLNESRDVPTNEKRAEKTRETPSQRGSYYERSEQSDNFATESAQEDNRHIEKVRKGAEHQRGKAAQDEVVSETYPNEEEKETSLNFAEVFISILELVRSKEGQINREYQYIFEDTHKIDRIFTRKGFSKFLSDLNLGIPSDFSGKLAALLDANDSDEINLEDFLSSFRAYCHYYSYSRTRISDIMSSLYKQIIAAKVSLTEFETQLFAMSEYGYVKPANLRVFLESIGIKIPLTLFEEVTACLESGGNNYIFVAHLIEYLQAIDIHSEVRAVKPNLTFLTKLILESFQSIVSTIGMTKPKEVERLMSEISRKAGMLTISDLLALFEREGIKLSYLELYLVFEQIENS
eukprot:TRINITY_DN2218_c0_g1_i7.p1 TRINITY_DN2218_c0_g1~~TRINITY_DN2218_c0_g1_i7.p1  ORF type:complete len:434 (+),score=61.95 TRINITY_DN2218_c0_g1_i7:65-1366(+)